MASANIKTTFLCPVERVWQVVTDLTQYGWRSNLERIEVIDEAHFVEYTKEGFATRFHVTAMEKHQLWEFEMENDNMKGRWSGKFYGQGDRTTLDFTEEVTAKKLVMKPFVGGYLKKQQRQYVHDLKQALSCEEAGEAQIL